MFFNTTSTSNLHTVFSDPDVRPALVNFFFVHTIQVSSTEFISNSFAYVNWPMHHPLHNSIGKPYEVWCFSLYENSNCIVPSENIVSQMLTAQQVFEEENVLVTIPLVSLCTLVLFCVFALFIVFVSNKCIVILII